MNARMPTPEGVIRNQVTSAQIAVSLIVAYSLNLLPWHGTALLVRPDLLLLVMIYWCIEEPRRVGATTAFFLGLLMDVAESSLTGQNALVYSLSAYLAITFRLRILAFTWLSQALQIFPILLLGQALFVLQQLILDTPFPGLVYFLRSVLGMALWPILSFVLELPRRRQLKDELQG
jgi:rod shape-determining protein MreD